MNEELLSKERIIKILKELGNEVITLDDLDMEELIKRHKKEVEQCQQ